MKRPGTSSGRSGHDATHGQASPSISKAELGMLRSMSSLEETDDTSPDAVSPPASKSTALRDDVLLDVKYLKDVYQGLDDESNGM